MLEYGGGGMMDIGCYLIFTARFIFDEEPTKVFGVIEEDPQFRTDVLSSGVMQFPSGHAVFTCSTQSVPYQKVQIFGTERRIEIEIPFNAPPDKPCRIYLDNGADPSGRSAEVLEFPTTNQYTVQGDLFSQSICEGTPLAVPLEGSIKNMAVIEAVFRSAKSGNWEEPVAG
jgi:predicted dehydrogenase